MKTFAEEIKEERLRQVLKEGFTILHDDRHDDGEMARAAAVYAMPAEWRNTVNIPGSAPLGWPWEPEWWKPTPEDRQRELIKAGALLCAEYDRLERLKEKR